MKPVKLSRSQRVLVSILLLFSICITCGEIPPAAAQDSISEEVEQVASFDEERAIAVRQAAELAAGTNWRPAKNPKHSISPREMRSDTKVIPGELMREFQ